MVFYRQDRPYCQDRPLIIKVESRRILQNLVESRPITIKIGFQLGSSCNNKVLESNNKVLESNDKVEFL